jgi:hypothetical protein
VLLKLILQTFPEDGPRPFVAPHTPSRELEMVHRGPFPATRQTFLPGYKATREVTVLPFTGEESPRLPCREPAREHFPKGGL